MQVHALKARPHASRGHRPGFRNQSIVVRPERAQGILRPLGAGNTGWARLPRVVAPGWYSPRRWRGNVPYNSEAEMLDKLF